MQQLLNCLLMCNSESFCNYWDRKIWQIYFVFKFNICFIIGLKFMKCICQHLRLLWYTSNFTFKSIFNPADSMWIQIWKLTGEPMSLVSCRINVYFMSSQVIFSQSSKKKDTFEKASILFRSAFCPQYKSFNPKDEIFSLAEIILIFCFAILCSMHSYSQIYQLTMLVVHPTTSLLIYL